MSKVLMISTDRQILNPESAVAARVARYGEAVQELHIIVLATEKIFTPISLADNVWAYSTNSSSRWLYPFNAYRLAKKIINQVKPTLITCQDPFETGLVGKWLAQKFNLPLEIQIHTDLTSPYFVRQSVLNRLRLLIAQSVLPRAAQIRVVSQKIKEGIVKKYNLKSDSIYILPIAITLKPSTDTWVSPFAQTILVVSRLEAEKNVSLALKILAFLPDQSIGLVVVGGGREEKALKRLAQKLGIEDRVVWLGPQRDVWPFYQAAKVFLMPSIYEGYGLVLVEAASLGLPIVSTDVGVAREVGATIIPNEPKTAAQALLEALKSPKASVLPAGLLVSPDEYLAILKAKWR